MCLLWSSVFYMKIFFDNKRKQKLNKLINKNLETSKTKIEKINIKLSKKEDKLSKFNTRNINKRLNQMKILEKKNQMKILQKRKSIWKASCVKYWENLYNFQDQFQKCKTQNENLRKKIRYWKNSTLKLENHSSEKHIKEKLSFKIKELEQVIKYRKNKKSLVKEKIDDFENKNK